MAFRMQSIEARTQYKNSFVCAARIFKDEGVLTFWSGAMPRFARLVLSGGIMFTVYVFLQSPVESTKFAYRYEKMMDVFDFSDPYRRYI